MESEVLTPKKVLEMYYLDTRWHVLEIAAMLDRLDRSGIAYPDGTAGVENDLRNTILREALELLARPAAEPNRAERLLNLFSRLDVRHAQEGA